MGPPACKQTAAPILLALVLTLIASGPSFGCSAGPGVHCGFDSGLGLAPPSSATQHGSHPVVPPVGAATTGRTSGATERGPAALSLQPFAATPRRAASPPVAAVACTIDAPEVWRGYFNEGQTPRADHLWDDELDATCTYQRPSGVQLGLAGYFADFRALTEDTGPALVQGAFGSWEQGRLADVTATASLLGDRLRITSRHAGSTYRLYGPYSDWLKNRLQTRYRRPDDDDQGRERFEGAGTVSGAAMLHRLEADIWTSPGPALSLFSEHYRVDRNFESLREADDDPFERSGRETVRAGASLGFGPFETIIAREFDRALGGAEEARYEATVGLDLVALRSRSGGGARAALWLFAPDSAWFSIGRGVIQGTAAPGRRDDRTRDMSLGVAWSRNAAYLSAEYWQSAYDGDRSGAAAYRWAGSGGYAGIGFNGQAWSVYTDVGFYDSGERVGGSRSDELGHYGNLTLSFRPHNFPDVSAGLFLGRYRSGYVSPNASSNASSIIEVRELGLALDFSKYLPLLGASRSLRLFFDLERTNIGDENGMDRKGGRSIAALLSVAF